MSDVQADWIDIEEVVDEEGAVHLRKRKETCAKCNEEFLELDIRLVVPGQPARHYGYCPRDRWTPTKWDNILEQAKQAKNM